MKSKSAKSSKKSSFKTETDLDNSKSKSGVNDSLKSDSSEEKGRPSTSPEQAKKYNYLKIISLVKPDKMRRLSFDLDRMVKFVVFKNRN